MRITNDPREPPREDPDGSDLFPGNSDATALASEWSVPWSDLMMVMFVLFAVLFIYELAERDVREAFSAPLDREQSGVFGGDLPDIERGPSDGLYEQTLAAVRETDLENIDVELRQDRSVKLSVKGSMFFELGSAELRPRTRQFLDSLAGILRGNDHPVEVIGHTDSFPVSNERFPTNWELSAVRATHVVRYLVDQGRLEPERFTAVAHSMYRPAVPNDSLDNKALNRRVEIIVTPREHRQTETSGS